MNTARTILVLLLALVAGVIGYGIGVAQNVAVQTPAGAPAVGYWHPWTFGFFPFFGFLFPLLFLFLIFGLLRAAFWGWGGGRRYYGPGMWGDRRAQLEELHRQMHEEQGTGSGTNPPRT